MKTIRRLFPRAAVALVLLAAASAASARQQQPAPKVRLPEASPQAHPLLDHLEDLVDRGLARTDGSPRLDGEYRPAGA